MAQAHAKTMNPGTAALALLMLYWALIAPASVLHFFGIKGLYSTLLALALAAAIGIVTSQRISITALLVSASLVFLSTANALHWNDVRYIFYCIFFICALLLVDMAGKQGIERFCTIATKFAIILLVGAILSFIIARLGLPPLLTITNPDGQNNYFFYTGFTNSYYDDFIRASAIYDEPGAFSMYICFVAAMRHLLNRDRKTTWLMLMSGFITFSLAHLIYVFCHFLAEQPSRRKVVISLSLLAFSLFAMVTSISPDSNIVLLSRLALTEDTNFFVGDNRSFQLFNAWSQISENPSSILFGLDSTCIFSQAICQNKFGGLGENPLSPLAFGGLLSEGPYYVTVIVFLLSPFFSRRYLVLLGIGLLFLQRPYVMGFSYSLIAICLLSIMSLRGRARPRTTFKPRGARRTGPRYPTIQPFQTPQPAAARKSV
jgi:hypothetical protein